VNKEGAIRFGLAAIKGMGASAAEAIISERDKNGQYADVYDVAKRVNLSAVNKKAFESLALSGGFDSFNIARERYLAVNNKGDVFLDTLVRFGQMYQNEKMQAQMSLFGSESIEIANPPIPESEPWSNIERLNRERDLVGIYLSAHPLDEYSMILNHMCNTACSELDDKEALAKRESVTFGGVVTSVKSRFAKNGNPFGIVTIEDFKGSGELALFGEEWGKWRGMLVESSNVYVTAKMAPRFRGSNLYEMRIGDIQYMHTVKEQRIDKLTIVINSDKIDSQLVTDLLTVVADNPGETALYFQIRDAEGNGVIHLRSKGRKVELTHQFVMFVEQNNDLNYFIN
jgi:DNA polymerase-3 subunit alpha